MSQGFSKWSNNDNSDPNIRAVRFGYSKPILEAELNELQDLNFSSEMHLNRVMFSPNTYSSTAGSTLNWEYSKSVDTMVANLVLNVESLEDVIAFNFSGGLVYYYVPKQLGRQILVSVELPLNALEGSHFTYVCKAKLKTLSPDFADEDYDARVAYAVDPRYPSLVTTKRVVIESGFDGEFSDIYFDDFKTIYSNLLQNKITGLNSTEEAYLILGSWSKYSDESDISSYVDEGAVRKVVVALEESKSSLITDCNYTYGTYSMTPYDSEDMIGSQELRIDFPIKSFKFGYYAVINDGKYSSTKAVPINHPTIIGMLDAFITLKRQIALFSLEDLVDDTKAWEENYANQSWEDLLNQKWFNNDITNVKPTLILDLKSATYLKDVKFGSLEIVRKEDEDTNG